MGCRAPWVLDIRKRNLASEALAFAGTPIKTGDEALDETVVVQGDDEIAIDNGPVLPRSSRTSFSVSSVWNHFFDHRDRE